MTPGQISYVKMLQSSKPICVVTGPAGSGKTMLACQNASERLKTGEFKRIILTRPIVTTDEDLGYLPGEIDKKMEPWTKPMIDVMEEYLTKSELDKKVVVEPLGFMRGRTFKNSYIIADEMQNSTINQMKMMLTRLGENSMLVIAGDIKQSDLGYNNGLTDLSKRLDNRDLEYISRAVMKEEDIVRHPAVSEVLFLY